MRAERESRLAGNQAARISRAPETGVSIPTVVPLGVHEGRRTRTVKIACPYCGRRHSHPWLTNDPEPGYRAAECLGGGQYRILAPAS
jgi:hypothetical protein